MNRLVVIEYEPIYEHEIHGDRFDWVADTIKGSFIARYCYSIEMTVKKFEVVIMRELVEFIVRNMEFLKYKHMDSDVFEYMSAFKVARCRWYYGENNTSLDT